MSNKGPRITPERIYQDMSDFANNNPGFKKGLVDEYSIEATTYDYLDQTTSPDEDGDSPDSAMAVVTQNFRAQRYKRNAPEVFTGGFSVQISAEDLPQHIKSSLEYKREELADEGFDLDQPNFMRSIEFSYGLGGETYDAFWSNMSVRYLTNSVYPELLVSALDKKADDDLSYMRGRILDSDGSDEESEESQESKTMLIQSYDDYHVQRLDHESLFVARTPLDGLDDEMLRVLGLPGGELDYEAERYVQYANLRMATFAFRSLRTAIRRQAGIQC